MTLVDQSHGMVSDFSNTTRTSDIVVISSTSYLQMICLRRETQYKTLVTDHDESSQTIYKQFDVTDE